MRWDNSVLYEQPVTELIRLFLRLEKLFHQIQYFYHEDSVHASALVLQSMLEIVNISIDRPDLKTCLIKELMRHHANLSRLMQIPHIDHSRLTAILNELDHTVNLLNAMEMKFAQRLRDHEFLNSIRLQLANPGGICTINHPSLNHWLSQTYAKRQQQLKQWLEEVNIVHTVIQVLLRLTRESNVAEFKTAHQGFYEHNLDAKQPCQLIRLHLPGDCPAYPEISVGRHRLCIRFLSTDFNGRALQAEKDITFKLTCCII